MRIAHLSDLHFSSFYFGLTQFLSKRWLGNLNLLVNRRRHYHQTPLLALPLLLKSLEVTHVIITGDLTTTSLEKEYAIAHAFIEQFKKEGLEVFVIPGNHDHYTKHSYKIKRFYQYFPSQFSPCPFNLKDHGVTAHQLGEQWTLLALDTTLATPLTSSNGSFSQEIEAALHTLLAKIPNKEQIVLINHFPFFQHDRSCRHLWRGLHLQKTIEKYPNIQLYLHGHTHRRCIADLRSNGLPIVLDSGSTAHHTGAWNLLDIYSNRCNLQVYQYQNNQACWNVTETREFKWTKR